MKYVLKCLIGRDGQLKVGYYLPYWWRFQDYNNFKGNYKKMHAALLKYEEYIAANRNDIQEMKFYDEISAIVASFGIRPERNFMICHQDDFRFDAPPDYYFCWDAGNIVWSFPGGYIGSIWV